MIVLKVFGVENVRGYVGLLVRILLYDICRRRSILGADTGHILLTSANQLLKAMGQIFWSLANQGFKPLAQRAHPRWSIRDLNQFSAHRAGHCTNRACKLVQIGNICCCCCHVVVVVVMLLLLL
jgi:hypothetical protein